MSQESRSRSVAPVWSRGVGVAAAASLSLLLSSLPVRAAVDYASIDGTTVRAVAVSKGNQANPGVTCLQVEATVDASCPHGYIAIRDNDPLLVAAAMQAKASNAKVFFVYEKGLPALHCPWLVMTPCVVGAIVLK